ncbi:MAG: amino acid adenylation domain-containing protein, partial [Gammaproteobacteria bacterium]|nr:amino acid adenylation domain-containing protein [Gammaproteobacteria bacterium]
LISTRSSAQDASIAHADRDFPIPLSFGQERLWFLNELEPGSSLYNIPTAIKLKGSLNLQALQLAFDQLLERHESLRTTFTLNGEQPVQKIATQLSIALEKHDANNMGDDDLNALLTTICLKPFNIKQGPLLKLCVIEINEDEHALLLVIHHIIADGWSMGLLMSELAELYNSIASKGSSTLSALPIQFADYAVWQRETMSGDTLNDELSYWKIALDDAPLVLDLPTDHPRPASPGYEGAWVRHQIPKETRGKLEALAQDHNASLYMVLLSAFHILLSRQSGSEELVIGSPVAGRSRTELEGIIGSLINTVALRGDLSGNPQFSSFLEQVRDTTLNAFEHQNLPFEKLVEELQPERSMSHAPIYQVLFNLQNRSQEVVNFNGLKSSALITETGTAKLDLHLLVEETDTGLTAWFEYATELFDKTTIERMAVQFERLLDNITVNPNIPVSQINLTSAEEQQQLQVVLNASEHDYSRPECLHQLFEQQVSNNPAATALTCDGESLSYAELNARANRLAHHLIAKGLGADTLIGISMERSLDLVVGILGVLKAGCGYLPLDPNYPEDRLAFMVEDSQTPIIVTHSEAAERVPANNAEIVVLETLAKDLADTNPNIAVSSSQLAYVIYTSGSTGKPKGVLIEHANVTRLMRATEDWYNFNDDDVWTLFHSYAFDFTVWELWGSLLYGGRLVVVPYFVSRSTEEFYDLLVAEKVTVLNQTPSAFSALMRVDETAAKDLSLRYVVFGGEALDLKSLKPWFERHGDSKPQLVNMYGITETTVHVTYRPLVLADCDAPSSNIGIPIPDLQVYVLNESRIPVPVGTPGEMYVGGAGLARGYLNRPELTDERFVPHPFDSTPDARLYRTGDLARRRPDGDLEYMGRADDQVKLRGFRIELGEIESALLSHPAVNESIVVLLGETADDQKLVAYVVATPNASLEVADLRQHMKAALPDYMVPAAIIELDALPLTANGKIDRKALPKPSFDAAEYVAPETETEIQLTAMFSKLLDTPEIGVDDDFFALGGHSLLATRLITRIREQLQSEIELKQMFLAPTVKALSALIDGKAKASQGESIQAIPRDADLPLSFAQQRLWFLHKLMP